MSTLVPTPKTGTSQFYVSRNIYLLLIVSLIFFSAEVKSQVATYYTWTQSSGTYTPGVSTTSTTPANIFSTGWDDVAYNAYALPFSFTYNGTAYNNIGVDADGWITFSNGAPVMTGNAGGGSWISSTQNGAYLNGTANNNGFAGFNCDMTDQGFTGFTGTRTASSPTITGVSSTANLQIGTRLVGTGIPDGTVITAIAGTTVTMSANATVSSSTSITPRASIYAFTSGSAPNRKYVIQWTQAKRFNNSGNDNFNFQLILNEGGGNPTLQTIQVMYGACSSTAAANLDIQVGLRGASSADFNARKSTTGWGATVAATANTDFVRFTNTLVPANGLTYTWSPCTSAPGAAGSISGAAAVCPSTTSNYTLTAVPGATLYSWSYSGTGVNFPATTTSPSITLTFSAGATAGNLVVTASNICGTGTSSPAFSITVNSIPTAAISYPAASYCSNVPGNIAVNQTGTPGGTYSASPAGLTINAATGAITPSTSTAATYTVTYSFSAGGCSNTTTTSVTIKDIPNVAVLPASPLICANNNVQLNAYAGTTASYTVVSVPYNSLNPSGSPTNIWTSFQDDVVSGAIAIPFSFKFYGQAYTQLYVYSNGFVQLGTSSASTGTTAQNIPNAANPNNLIALAWSDLAVDPSLNANARVRYFTNGIAPNRVFVIEYSDLSFYDFFGDYGDVSGQIRLYEADNHIEVAAGRVDDEGSSDTKTLGIENSTGTSALAPAGRNASAWNVSAPEAWAFYPSSGSYTYSWSPSTYLSSPTIANPVATNVATTITYTVTATDVSPGGCSRSASTTITVSAPLNGIYTVGAAGNYPTLTAAVNAYNNVCVTGPVVFSLIDASYSTNESFPIIINNNVAASATNTLTIKPAAGVNATVSGASSSVLLQLKGADYVMIDGSNVVNGTTKNLTLTNQAGSSNAVIWLTSASASNGATGNTIKNCNIYGYNGSATVAGILTGSCITAGNDAEFPNNNNTIQNNLIYKAQNGIYQRGKTSSLDQNWLITKNTIGSAVVAEKMGFRGIAVLNAQNFNVTENTISGIASNTSSTLSGISCFLNINTGNISNNKISDVKNADSYGSNGICAAASTTASNLTIANNFVFDIASYGYSGFTSVDNGYGIVLDGGGGYKVYFNTSILTTNQSSTSQRSAALLVSSAITTANSIDMRNNIFINVQSAGNANSRFALLITAANSVFSNTDYNDYLASNGNILCRGSNATIYTTMPAVRTSLGSNLNSISVNPTFVSSTDYHIQSIAANASASNLGTPIAGFTTDYDNTTRNGYTPDMGADEWLMPNTGSWVGKTSVDWLTDTNWETNKVPDGTTDVTITGGYTFMPTIVTTQAIRNLVLNAPVPANTPLLTLNSGTLQINGTITRTGGNIEGSQGTVEMNGTAAQNIPVSLFVNNKLKNLVIGNSNATGVTLGGAVDIYRSLTFSASGLKLTTNNFLTFKSTATETAWLGNVTGKTISGSATVERYIPTGINHGKSWQLLAVPVRGTQSVKASWQENNAPLVPGTAGFGTTISSEKPGATGRGYDFYTAPGPSMKTYNSASNSYVGIDNGSTPTASLPIVNQKGYMILVRGDRFVQTSAAAATPTVLRTFGPLYTATAGELPPGTSVAAGKLESIGNPYASAIDFTAITKSAGIDDVFYVWDPLLAGSNTLGGYQTISGTTGYLPTPGSANYPAATPVTKIQSGQAFLVHATAAGTVSFTEASKISGSRLITRQSSPLNSNRQFLRMLLYNAATAGYGAADGNTVAFDENFSNDFDANDAVKLNNTSENTAISSNQQLLAVEARSPVIDTDTIFYHMANLKQQHYQLRFGPEGMSTAGLTAYLVDRFMHLTSTVSLSDTSFIDFDVTNEPASAATDRFFLVFKKLAIVPLGGITIAAERTNENAITVKWKQESESGIVRYETQRSADGRSFENLVQTRPRVNNGSSQAYSIIDENPLDGDNYYRILALHSTAGEKYSSIVKVAAVKSVADIKIYPNPVENKKINVRFTGQLKGVYDFQLTNKLGELVYKTRIELNNENGSVSLRLPLSVAAGTYQLKISGPAGQAAVVKQVIIPQ